MLPAKMEDIMLKINKHFSLKVADKVLTELRKHGKHSDLVKLSNGDPVDLHVECFDNCREQGYCLHVFVHGMRWHTFHVAFVENRNSDHIVVYCYYDTMHPSNLPDQDG